MPSLFLHGGKVGTSVSISNRLLHCTQCMTWLNIQYKHRIHNSSFHSLEVSSLVSAVVQFTKYFLAIAECTNDVEKCPSHMWMILRFFQITVRPEFVVFCNSLYKIFSFCYSMYKCFWNMSATYTTAQTVVHLDHGNVRVWCQHECTLQHIRQYFVYNPWMSIELHLKDRFCLLGRFFISSLH